MEFGVGRVLRSRTDDSRSAEKIQSSMISSSPAIITEENSFGNRTWHWRMLIPWNNQQCR